MRRNLKPSSFKLWRKRVSGRKTKHKALCLVFLPETLFLQSLKLEGLRFLLISEITSDSFKPNVSKIAIFETFGLNESEVISLMRRNLKPSSFKLWRKRVSGRKTKHEAKRNFQLGRFKCSRQRNINQNKISKRNASKRN